jgi:hypothetical protein
VLYSNEKVLGLATGSKASYKIKDIVKTEKPSNQMPMDNIFELSRSDTNFTLADKL